jgi:hypothetical protein
MCDIHISQKLNEKITKKSQLYTVRVSCFSRIIIYTHAQIVIMSNRYFVKSTASTGL